MTDYQKAVRLEDLPDEAWVYITGRPEKDQRSVTALFGLVSWLYRCVTIRGNTMMSIPHDVMRGSDVVASYDGLSYDDDSSELPFLNDIPLMLKYIQEACCLGGSAYFERRSNQLETGYVQFDWLLPHTIRPVWDSNDELVGFKRQEKNRTIALDIDDVAYFWRPDTTVERGPPKVTPARTALVNVSVVHNMDVFLDGYFNRGMVKAHILKTHRHLQPEERDRTKSWFRRIFMGNKNAHTAEIVRADLEIQTIGDGIGDLKDNVTLDKEREAIAVALGIPNSKVTANAANFATKQGDDISYIEDTMLPEMSWIFKAFNDQCLPDEYALVPRPQRMRIMQVDEEKRSAAFRNYTGAGIPNETAVGILGITVPEGLPLKKETPPQLMQPADPTDEIEKALKVIEARNQFKRWLSNRKTFDLDDFQSDVLTADDKIKIAIQQLRAATDYSVIKALDGRIDDYINDLADMILDMVDKSVDPAEMSDRVREHVENALTAEFKTAANVEGDLSPDQRAALAVVINPNLQLIDKLLADALSELSGKGLLSLGERSGRIAARLRSWGNALRLAANLGSVNNVDSYGEKMTWQLGQTEEHCSTCLRMHGQTKTRQQWAESAFFGIFPQSRQLDCKGYNCDCTLVA